LSLSARAPFLFLWLNPKLTRRIIKTSRPDLKIRVYQDFLPSSREKKEGRAEKNKKLPKWEEINEFSFRLGEGRG